MTTSNLAPVVVVGGFLTRNSTSYWGDIQQHFAQQGQNRKVIIAPVGACSSLHDRACEIFYSLKGGRVDYGAEHSKDHKHGQYGRKYSKGLYPEWSTDKPVHFVTHSLGGPTVTKLIALLRAKFFGDEYHPDMVRSVFAVAAPFKGTPTVYLLGASYTGSHMLRTFSLGNFLAKYIHISSFLRPLFSYDPEAWDFQPDSRNLGIFSLPNYSEPDVQEEEKPSWSWGSLKQSVSTLWSQLRTSDWADSADSGSYDATFHAADARDRAGESVLNANTFYCSLMGTITTKEAGSNHHRPDRSVRGDIFLYILAKMVGSFSYNVQPAPDFLFQTPPKPAPCSHPVAQARRLTIQTSRLSSTDSGPDAVLCRPPLSATPSSAASSSGSSGWHSPTTSFSFSRSSSESNRIAEEETSNLASSLQAALQAASSVPAPTTAPAAYGELSRGPEPPRSRRSAIKHSRHTSVTDCYADWAAEWSSKQHVSPGAWDIRDAETAVSTVTPFKSSPSDVEEPVERNTEKEEEKPVTRKLRDDLWENDGVVAVYSQTHPSECSDEHCRHHGDLDLSAVSCSARAHTTPQIGKLESGIWHVFKSAGMTHNCLVGGLARYDAQRSAVWTKISEALLDLDRARTMI